MREYTLPKDGRPRFLGGSGENTIIVDATGYHEYCAHCKHTVLEYLVHSGLTERSCHCSHVQPDELITQLWRSIDECKDVESVKRMLMMFVSAREMSA